MRKIKSPMSEALEESKKKPYSTKKGGLVWQSKIEKENRKIDKLEK